MLTFGELKYGKRQATLAEVLSWADTVIDNVENTETGWGNCGPQIINAAGDRLAVVVDFNLKPTARKTSQVDVVEYGEGEISAWEGADEQQLKQEEATTDVTLNLQYFFPLCDQALFDDPRREIIFIVTCRDADQWRIRRYLGAQSRVKERLCICTAVLGSRGKTELSIVNYNAEDIGDLFPLLCVGETTYLGNGGNIRKMEDLTIRTLSSSSRELYQYATGKKVSFVHLARYPQYYMLLKAGCHAVDKINEKLMGKVKNEEKIRERQKLQRDFWSIVADQHGGFERQPFLTQVIWLCSLRHLMEQDELRNAEESCTDYFQNSKIYLSLWDAVAYGEGILQLLENCELHSQHHMGYLSIYFHDVGLKKVSSINDAAARRTRIFRKYRMKRSDSIVQPDESCYMEFNVTDMGRDKAYRAKGIEVTSGHELSALFGGLTEDTIENAVHHYGMPLFFRTVMRKCGRFICSTPDGKQTVKQYLAGKYADKDNSPDPQCFQRSSQQAWTSYQILLPVTFRGYMLDEVKADHTQMFDAALMNEPVMPQDYRQKWINENLFLKNNRILSVDAKIREAKDIGNVLLDSAEKENINTTVFYLNFKGLSAINVELYIKGVFHFIAQKKISGEECKRILLRLVFSDEFALSEALRRFAIFYDRFGKSRWMKDVQVALCVQDQENAEQQNSQVRLILAGEHIYEAYITAKQYMHYNVDLTSGFLLSQVEYLTSCEKDKGLGKGAEKGVTGVPVFPFDLVKGADGKSDFLKKMEMQLQSDLQKQGYGCKITDAHIRLGSKIHIRDFYDAELLFQSIGNVYRFAYLLAGSMIQELRKSKSADISTLLLIGYESYSAVLVNEVKRLLEQLLQAAQEEKIKIEHLQ